MKGKDVHVLPDEGKWQVKMENEENPEQIMNSQEEAIGLARDIAKKNHSELIIHAHDGTIREKSTWGKDPFPPEG